MRMTRAALRAQEAGDDVHPRVEDTLKEPAFSYSQIDALDDEPMIHEDTEEVVDNVFQNYKDLSEDGRQALRDITGENYPTTEIVVLGGDDGEENGVKVGKKTKGRKGKKVGCGKKNVVADGHQVGLSVRPEIGQDSDGSLSPSTFTLPSDVSQESEHSIFSSDPAPAADISPEASDPSDLQEITEESFTDDTRIVSMLQSPGEEIHSNQQDLPTETSIQGDMNVSGSQEEASPLTPISKPGETIPKTPRFNPDIHLAAQPTPNVLPEETEDSFVESIKTRSPSKFSQTITDLQIQEDSNLLVGTPAKHIPQTSASQLSSPSSQRIEDSVDAIDALEDAIEKFAEDMPVMQPLSLESPVKSRQTPARTAKKTPVKTPAKSPAKSFAASSVKAVAKTPSKAVIKAITKTPIKTPAQAANPTSSNTMSSVGRVAKCSPPDLNAKMASTKRETVKDRVKAIETRPAPAAHRRATSVSVLRKGAPEIKSTLKSRHMGAKSISTVASAPAPTISFSNSPIKQSAIQPKKRVTSGGVLSTSKPGFVPAKSNKATTTASFTLPGEAITAKLKAQREEKLKREEVEAEKKAAFKARPAPTQAARPSIMPRENKASTARMSVRQASGENKENVAPAQSTQVMSSSTAKSSVKPGATISNSSGRRTTTAPKPASTIESRKSTAVPSTLPAETSERIASLTSGHPMPVTKAEAAQQRQKGKEVLGRMKSSIQQQNDDRKAKEEAARKARAEAAERGRQASREWAEKQKKRLTMAVGAKPVVVEAES